MKAHICVLGQRSTVSWLSINRSKNVAVWLAIQPGYAPNWSRLGLSRYSAGTPRNWLVR